MILKALDSIWEISVYIEVEQADGSFEPIVVVHATNFYTHDGAGNHTVTMNISPIGDVTIAGKLLDNNLKMVDTGEFTNKFMFYKRFSNLGDNIQFPTRISPSDFQCGIAGLNTTTGDIEENGSGAIIQVPTYVARVTQPSHPDFGEDRWHIQGEFRTHNTGDNWTITLLCVSTELADWFGENDLIPGP